MRIIDQTPQLNEQGKPGILQKIQGLLKLGFRGASELEAQNAIVNFLEHQLEKGYTLIRNVPLGASGIFVPMILLGPAGIYVISVTYLRGRYEARGTAWNEASGDEYKPASANLIQETARMGRAVKAFIERQGVTLPVPVEPVLIAANPGLHVETVRPAIKVLMIDGVKSFVSSLAAAQPVLTMEAVHDYTERIINPGPPRKDITASPPSAASDIKTEPPAREVSRARAIFDAAEEAKPFNPADFDFAMLDEEPALEAVTPSVQETSPAQPIPGSRRRDKRILGMTRAQLAVVAGMAIALLCILAIFAYLIYSTL